MSTHSSPTLWRSAGLAANFWAATAARLAIVVAPASALRDGVLAVPASIRSLQESVLEGGSYVSASASRTRALPLACLRQLRLALELLHRAHEECLVHPALKDPHPQLQALRDDFPAVHFGLPGQRGGRQVDRH